MSDNTINQEANVLDSNNYLFSVYCIVEWVGQESHYRFDGKKKEINIIEN